MCQLKRAINDEIQMEDSSEQPSASHENKTANNETRNHKKQSGNQENLTENNEKQTATNGVMRSQSFTAKDKGWTLLADDERGDFEIFVPLNDSEILGSRTENSAERRAEMESEAEEFFEDIFEGYGSGFMKTQLSLKESENTRRFGQTQPLENINSASLRGNSCA